MISKHVNYRCLQVQKKIPQSQSSLPFRQNTQNPLELYVIKQNISFRVNFETHGGCLKIKEVVCESMMKVCKGPQVFCKRHLEISLEFESPLRKRSSFKVRKVG